MPRGRRGEWLSVGEDVPESSKTLNPWLFIILIESSKARAMPESSETSTMSESSKCPNPPQPPPLVASREADKSASRLAGGRKRRSSSAPGSREAGGFGRGLGGTGQTICMIYCLGGFARHALEESPQRL